MAAHFEDLWEQCEKLHSGKDDLQSIINELSMKINLYNALSQKSEIPQEELKKIKIQTMGEILLTITNLSLVDNINVFEALDLARRYRNS